MDFGALNRGIVAYLGEGGSAGDHARQDSVAAGAHDLLQAVKALVKESLAVPAHWNTTSPVVGAAIMKREMKRRHEQLDDSALDALARNFAAAWR